MRQRSLHTLFTLSLALLTLGVVALSLADALPVVGDYVVELGVFALLTAFAVTYSLRVGVGELGIAHSVGMMAFLSLEAAAQPALTVAIFLGALLGGVALAYVAPRLNRVAHVWPLHTLVFMTAQSTLAFFVASRAYLALNGTLPIQTITSTVLTHPALLVFILLYAVLYFVLFVLHVYSTPGANRTPTRDDVLSIAIIVLLPVPFSLVGAQVGRVETSLGFFTITVIGIVLIIFGLYALNHVTQQLRRRLDETSKIAGATQAFGRTLDYDTLLRTIYDQVRQLLGVQEFSIAWSQTHEEQVAYLLVVREGVMLQHTEILPDDDGLVQHVLATAAPLLLADAVAQQAQALAVQAPAEQVSSWLGVPVQIGPRVAGAFVARSLDDAQRLTATDAHLLAILSSSAGIAIENARLYKQQAERAEQLATLSQISALLTVTLSPNEVLETIVTSASVISDADATAVYLYWDDEGHALTLMRSAGLSSAFTENPPLPLLMATPTDSGLFAVEPVIVRNVQNDAAALPVREVMLQEGVLGWVELALSIGGQALGVLALYYHHPIPVDAEQIDLLNAFSTQASQAINNARQYSAADQALEQRVEQIYTLATVGRLLNATLDLPQIYETVLAYATDATKADAGIVLLGEPHRLGIGAAMGYDLDGEQLAWALRNQERTLRELMENGQPVYVADTRTDPLEVAFLPTTRAWLLTPLVRGQDVFGCIVLESPEPNVFAESDMHFLSQIANQTVIASDNTQLFQRIREARDSLQAILNSIGEGIVLIDTAHVIALANPRIAMLGLDHKRLVGQPLTALVEGDQGDTVERLGFEDTHSIRELLAQLDTPASWSQPPNHNFEVRVQNNTHVIEREILPVRDDAHQVMGVLLVYYNRTEQYELERTREALSQMVVHDLRSPLTAVTTSLRLLREVVPLEAGYRPIVERTTDASRRAIRKVLLRVDALLDIARMESGEMQLETEPTDLAALVESVRAELHPMASELDVSIKVQMDADLPLLDVDQDKVERLVMNLVDNALKYSPANSDVRIYARQQPDADFLRLSVVDQGPGVPDDYKRRLFDRFVQIKGRETIRRGVGLGLTFCKLVAEAHGGQIWIEDNTEDDSGGSVFNCTLPVLHIGEPIE